MLFNSYVFILFFLPITFLIFSIISREGSQTAVSIWLIAASLFFYSWWNPFYVTLLILSLLFNFGIGASINKIYDKPVLRKLLLIFGIICNILTLAYYKYSVFVINIFNEVSGKHIDPGKIFLPLAISFFTLQQISYLVDAYRGQTSKFNFISYAASVTFFPHLIAGPIVRYRDLVPQFSRTCPQPANYLNLAVGLTLFFMGLFKKVILADHLTQYVDPAFAAANLGRPVSFLEAWTANMAFFMEIYLDFSGYSDMAIGLGRIFGVRLPVNFNSPLKSINFMDFWRRWHITLSEFARDYLYFPLGGSRKGLPRQYINIMIIMTIVGLWHGAAWTLILWGALHGLFILINHVWLTMRRAWGHDFSHPTRLGTWSARILTFLCAAGANALFRADDLSAALVMLKGLVGLNGIILESQKLRFLGLENLIPVLTGWGIQVGTLPLLKGYALEYLLVYLCIIFFCPNTQEIMSRFEPCLDFQLKENEGTWPWLKWKPTMSWAWLTGFIALLSMLLMGRPNPFLYFQF
jgi:alginate O-acetyltransferase complex protein AlgI